MMKIGDLIAVIDEDLEGTITSVQGNMICFQDEHGFNYQYPQEKVVLREKELYEGIKIKNKFEYTPPKSKKNKKNELVLDLHFEKIAPSTQNYDSFERLFLQKEKLLEMLDFCRENKIKRLEIIHGIGDGTLQQLVWRTLEAQVNIDFYNKEILHEQAGSVLVEFH